MMDSQSKRASEEKATLHENLWMVIGCVLTGAFLLSYQSIGLNLATQTIFLFQTLSGALTNVQWVPLEKWLPWPWGPVPRVADEIGPTVVLGPCFGFVFSQLTKARTVRAAKFATASGALLVVVFGWEFVAFVHDLCFGSDWEDTSPMLRLSYACAMWISKGSFLAAQTLLGLGLFLHWKAFLGRMEERRML